MRGGSGEDAGRTGEDRAGQVSGVNTRGGGAFNDHSSWGGGQTFAHSKGFVQGRGKIQTWHYYESSHQTKQISILFPKQVS